MFILCFLFLLIVYCVPSKSLSENKKPKKIDETLVNVSLLDLLSIYSGIITRGQVQNVQVFVGGTAGVHSNKIINIKSKLITQESSSK